MSTESLRVNLAFSDRQMHDVACAIALCVDSLREQQRELIMNVITQNESESAIELYNQLAGIGPLLSTCISTLMR